MNRIHRYAIIIAAILLCLLALGLLLRDFIAPLVPSPLSPAFNGERAYQDVLYQTSLGARTPGSAAHAQVVEWMHAELLAAGWQAETQAVGMMGHPIQNVIARRTDRPPQIILAAHYDSRLVADRDPDPARRGEPVPGANDGASGVAVLLELARALPKNTGPLWLVFFDAEDNGGLSGWNWILGSRAFVDTLAQKPDAAIIIDMVGDANLNIYIERNSDPRLVAQIWAQAAALGFEHVFIPVPKYSILDDHIPFIQAGIPAVDIIDFDYPYWHTSADTADKVSAQSLKAVGETLLAWVIGQKGSP
ncbi:MAG: M28 family peptidase [Anaerolineales bacterium]|nr:M28 family peptidase [Anaerolineales bacterium]